MEPHASGMLVYQPQQRLIRPHVMPLRADGIIAGQKISEFEDAVSVLVEECLHLEGEVL